MSFVSKNGVDAMWVMARKMNLALPIVVMNVQDVLCCVLVNW